MKDKAYLQTIIISGIKKIKGITVDNFDEILVSNSIHMSASDLIYLVDYIENELVIKIAKIFVNKDYRFLTVNHIVAEIENLA